MPGLLTGFFLILLHLFLGNLASKFIFNGFMPGSVLGMIFLFLSLKLNLIKSQSVGEFSKLVSRFIPLFFVPIGVGLMDSYEIVEANFLIIIFSSLISTILILLFVPKLYLWLVKRIGA